MSYFFEFRATGKADAKERAAAEFDKVVSTQAVHARDRAPVLALVDAFIDLVGDEGNEALKVSVNGSVGGPATRVPSDETTLPLTSAAASVSVSRVA
jgi:hypothetical protein